MIKSRSTLLLLVIIVLICRTTFAQTPERGPATRSSVPLTSQEKATLKNCVEIIRKCQLPDGAIVQANESGKVSSKVWIAPYFANHAAVALIADFERTKTLADLGKVGKWLTWCAKNQKDEGYWTDFEGTGLSYRSNDKVDAWDSSAAMFLLAAGRFQKAGGKVTPEIVAAAKKSLKCIETVTDKDGLTWATPSYKVKYLMDNVEVYAGLKASIGLFKSADAKAEATNAAARAAAISKKLPDFWRTESSLFAHALDEHGKYLDGLNEAYPHGLAQLFGICFISPKAEAFSAAKTFSPETAPSAAVGVERWAMAATRIGSKDTKTWKEQLVIEATNFSPQNVYVHRPALTVLVILEGANWMPSLLDGK